MCPVDQCDAVLSRQRTELVELAVEERVLGPPRRVPGHVGPAAARERLLEQVDVRASARDDGDASRLFARACHLWGAKNSVPPANR